MMDWTDRHDRFFLRQISARVRLYTEMVTAPAILHGDRARLLDFDAAEHPLALQLGGSDPKVLAEAARIGEDWGYDEINLNCGCPSDRVQSGRFGACLMREPDLVAECISAMRSAVSIPVTVKSRIGVDDQIPEDVLPGFVDRVTEAGCDTFIIHARKAWLQGLSPKENRDVPPLDYGLVHALKETRPDLTIVLNGGITSLEQAMAHLETLDGAMIGRAAYQTPWILSEADSRVFGEAPSGRSRSDVVHAMVDYAAQRLAEGTPLKSITRHMLGLFQGLPGARAWRRHLSENAHLPGATPQVLLDALALVDRPTAKAA